jgi:L-alanine-DL-glutamate epimerase-like enolase superfamily enzyme
LNVFLRKIKLYKPLWVEEILTKNNLHLFPDFKKIKLNFSYGENFNSYNDFVNLLVFYKFNYINPDVSHLTISDFFKVYYFIKKNNLKQKIIMHCWGGSVNLFASLSLAANIKDVVKFIEFPITDFSLNKPFIDNSYIKNSKYFFTDKIKNSSDIFNQKNFKTINFQKLTFNFN